MKDFFETKMGVEELSKDDIEILKRRLRRTNICLRLFYVILSIAIISALFIVIYHTKIGNIYSIVDKYNIFIELYIFYILSVVILAYTPFLILHIFFLELMLKGNSVIVCTGVMTDITWNGGGANGWHIYIWPLRLKILLSRWNVKKLKMGTCVQYRYTLVLNLIPYCISIRRYNNIMYDLVRVYDMKGEDFPSLGTELLAVTAKIKEMHNWEKSEVEKIKKIGIKGRINALLWKFNYYLYWKFGNKLIFRPYGIDIESYINRERLL